MPNDDAFSAPPTLDDAPSPGPVEHTEPARGREPARLMKRGREARDLVEPLTESAWNRRGAVDAEPASKRWKKYVARRVQRLLTSYFAAPANLPEPTPFAPVLEEVPEEEERPDVELANGDAPAPAGETALTRYFSWSRRRPDRAATLPA